MCLPLFLSAKPAVYYVQLLLVVVVPSFSSTAIASSSSSFFPFSQIGARCFERETGAARQLINFGLRYPAKLVYPAGKKGCEIKIKISRLAERVRVLNC